MAAWGTAIGRILQCWAELNIMKRGSLPWGGVAHAIVWTIWNERNCRVFEDVVVLVSRLIQGQGSWT